MTQPVPDLEKLPLWDAARLVQSETASATELVEACLRRVVEADSVLRAWAGVDADAARAHARTCRPDRSHGGWLAGAPVGIKDNIDVAGTPTAAGSPLLANSVPSRDAAVVRRLREAGATVLGKTACTELATNDPAPTRNPWNLAHTPGGSSAGSGVAVATGMCYASVDTQTAGDILRPAAYTGVVGFKPSVGRISRRGVLPVAWSIDTVGVQARTVRDVALLLSVLAGADPDDPTSTALEVPDLTGGVPELGHSPRVGVVRDYFYASAEEEAREHTDHVVETLAAAGAWVEEQSPAVDFPALHAAHRVVTFAECAAAYEDLYHRHARQMGEKLRTLLELGLVTPAVSYLQAQRLRQRVLPALDRAFDQVDVLIAPSAPGPAPDDPTSTGSSQLQIPWTFCGLPAVSIPTGLSANGLPLGIQLVGRMFSEQRLLETAQWCERVLDVRLPHPPSPATAE